MSRRAARRRAEHQAFGKRVRPQSVAAVQPDVGALAGRVEAEHRRRARDIGVDSTHHVVLHRAHGDRVLDDVDADELAAELAHERELAVDHVLAEVPYIQVHVLAVRPFESAPLFELGHHRPRDDVARAELHLVRHVALEEALAQVVQQVASLSPDRLGDQDAGERQPGRMELHHLHVFEADPRAVGERHAVARADVAVGGEGIDAAHAAGREDHRLGGDRVKPARANVERDHADTAAVLDKKLGHERLVVPRDLRVLQRGLEDGVQHVKPGFVGREDRAPGGHAAERTHGDGPVRVAAPRATPVLHLDDLDGRLAHEGFDHVLVGQVVRAFDRVERMRLVGVLWRHHGGGAALGGDSVAAHRVHLRDHPHLDPGIGLDCSYRCPDAGEPPADDQDVVALEIHQADSIWTRELTVDEHAVLGAAAREVPRAIA